MLNTTPYRHAEFISASHRVMAWCYTSKDPEPISGGRWVWHGAVSLKAPLTFRHAEHHPLPSC